MKWQPSFGRLNSGGGLYLAGGRFAKVNIQPSCWIRWIAAGWLTTEHPSTERGLASTRLTGEESRARRTLRRRAPCIEHQWLLFQLIRRKTGAEKARTCERYSCGGDCHRTRKSSRWTHQAVVTKLMGEPGAITDIIPWWWRPSGLENDENYQSSWRNHHHRTLLFKKICGTMSPSAVDVNYLCTVWFLVLLPRS